MTSYPANIVVDIRLTPGTGALRASGEAVHFTYDPSTFLCTRGDVIQWKCKQGPFALHFGERALLGKVVIRSAGAKTPGSDCYETKTFRVGFREDNETRIADGDIQQGMYKYSVAVKLEEEVREGDAIRLSAGVYLDASPGGRYEC
jgi:hypothetical protein